MARTKENYQGVLSGAPDVVMRSVILTVDLVEDPGRQVKVPIPSSKIPQLIKSLARAHARATGTSALMASLDDELGDGLTGPDRR